MFRWLDIDHTGSDHGLAIDDVTVAYTVPVGTNTTAAFTSATSSIGEAAGPATIGITITNPDPINSTSVTITASGATGRIGSFTSPVVAGGGATSVNLSVPITNNLLCDGNQNVTFTITGVTGGQGTPAIGSQATHVLTVNNDDVCTNVSFAAASATINESAGTYNVVVNITDFSPSVATSVDVVLASGNGARVNGFTSQTVTFPANTGGTQTVTLTITDNASCSDGNETLTFALENLTGGQGTPTVGANRTLTINDNDAVNGEVIARQAFDGLGSDNWAVTAGAGNISTTAGGSDSPANQRILSGTGSWQAVGAGATLELGSVDVSGYSSVALSVRTSGVSGNGTNGLDAGDYVRVFVSVNGAAFPGTADVEVTGNNNARWLYTGTQTATTTAGTPISVLCPNPGGTPATVNGPGTIVVNIPSGAQTVAIRIVTSNGSNEIWNVDDIQVTGNRCTTTYYSRTDGAVGDAIWSDSPTGTAGTVTFDRFKSMVVQNGDVVNINANTRIDDLTVEAGGQLDLAANTLTISGDLFDNEGTITAADNSTILLNSEALVTLESTSALDLFNLTANTPGDLLTDATISIRGTLLIEDGDFDASIANITLSSTNDGTGRLGPVASGSSYIGDLTVQRYIPTGRTNWRFLGSPVSGQTVNNWKDDFITAGFPGSHSPTFSNPPGSGNLWPSVRWYDETRLFNNIDTGWVGVSSNTQALEAGQGFAAWCGTGLDFTTAFTIDVTGEPHVAQTPITRNLDYTNTGSITTDGFNAVSNPLPSPILFSSLARTNVGNAVYIFNPAVGNVAVYDAFTQGTINNGTDTIQSSQAFMVQALSSGASISFEESDKVNDRQGGFFGGSQQSLFNGVRLKLTSGINAFSDETVVAFDNGSVGSDAYDVQKMLFAHPDAPQIASMANGGLLAINATGGYSSALEVPLMVDAAITGTYTVTASGMENIGLTCLVLEDLLTGTITPLVEGASYSFTMEANASTTEPRLKLHASVPVPLYAENTTCSTTQDGRGTVVHVGNGPMDITWTNAEGTVILQQTIEDGVAINNDLAPGSYGVTVSSEAGCGALSTSFTINAPTALEVEATSAFASCPNTTDGRVDLTVLGGTAPYTYLWSNGSNDEDLVAAAGAYTVTITDSNGCTVFTPEFTIVAGEGPVALAELSSSTVLVNTPVGFTNNSTGGDSHIWEFGDGQFTTEFAPEHTYATPGTYTVTLVVDNGSCTSTWTGQVIVETSTSISGNSAITGVNAWFANDKFVVEHGYNNGQPVTIEVLDATGRLHHTRQAAGTPARVNVPADGLSTGIWFIRIQNDGNTRTVRVPVVR